MACADGGKRHAPRAVYIDHAPRREIALERTGGFFLDLRPCRVGNRSKLAVKVIHERNLL
jgi:hypothetical protein